MFFLLLCSSSLQSSPPSFRSRYSAWMGPTHLDPFLQTLRRHRTTVAPSPSSFSCLLQDNNMLKTTHLVLFFCSSTSFCLSSVWSLRVHTVHHCGWTKGGDRFMHAMFDVGGVSLYLGAYTPPGHFSVFPPSSSCTCTSISSSLFWDPQSQQLRGGKDLHGNGVWTGSTDCKYPCFCSTL